MYSTTPTLLQSQNTDIPFRSTYNTTPTITEHRHPVQEHIQHHSYNHRTQTSRSGAHTTPLLQSQNTDIPFRSTYNTTPTITEHRHPVQEHIQHHSYNHRTQTSRSGARTTPLLQSQNTSTITEQRHPAKEQVHHLSYAPIIRNHSHN